MNSDIRIDKWLWAARFFKTRSLAQKAINNGQIQLDGQRPKPSRTPAVGQTVTVKKNNTTYIITIDALSAKRGSATIAATLYHEKEEDKAERIAIAKARKDARQSQPTPARHPDKREQRLLRRIKKYQE